MSSQTLADWGGGKTVAANQVACCGQGILELTTQVKAAWEQATADVASHADAALLEIAPGEEILDVIFLQYAGRHYDKRSDGPAIATEMDAPAELADLLTEFTAS